jgi:hypothetical protein
VQVSIAIKSLENVKKLAPAYTIRRLDLKHAVRSVKLNISSLANLQNGSETWHVWYGSFGHCNSTPFGKLLEETDTYGRMP